jgi:hypothetical protein
MRRSCPHSPGLIRLPILPAVFLARSAAAMDAFDVDKMLKNLMLKDMRIQCRLRGLSPAGGKEQLTDRLKEHMVATNDL